MKLPPLTGLLWILLLWTLFYATQGARAETGPAPPDMRVVIDISGSMKKTDPANLRVPAVKLLLNLAQDKSRFGVWTFGQQVNALVPHTTVNADWKKSAVGKVDAIHSRGLFTHIGAALEAAAKGETRPDPAWDRTIVLLSDGMVDISKDPAVNETEKNRILQELLPRLKAAGFRIRTVALSEQADQAFLKALALQTGGSFVLARTADELLKAFVETSDKINLPEQVPIEGDSFSIDDSVKEFTALIFRRSGVKATELIAPDGQRFSLAKGSRNLSWFADPRYDLVTVYNPAPGQWKIVADLDPSNRVTVVSDLQLEIQGLPDNVLEGERVAMTMYLAEQGRAIANPNFLELMDITFTQQTDKGETFEGKLSQHSDGTVKIPADGIYSAKLGRTLVQGEHTFTVLVDGKTFKRKKIHKMTVSRDVLQVKTEYRDEKGQVIQFLVAEPRPGVLNPESLTLVAQMQDPKGEKSIQNARLREDGRWQIDVPPYGALGNYDVLIMVKGKSSDGQPFELVQGPYSVDYTPLGMVDATRSSIGDPATPPVTFDSSALDVPSLDVEELPPDDLDVGEQMPADLEAAMDVGMDVGMQEELQAEAEPVAEPVAQSDTGELGDDTETDAETNWLLLASLFILGNLAIIGIGAFFYIKFLRKTDAEQNRVVEEIVELKQRQQEEKAAAKAAPAAAIAALEPSADALSAVHPALAIEPDMEPEMEPDLEPEEATMMRTSDEAQPPRQPVIPAAAPPPLPDPGYVNQTPPLELDDDDMIEIDDDFDDIIEEEEEGNLDDLDMMLREREQDGSETSINRTIDEMLEQPTVFPDRKKPEDDGEKSRRFSEDEFMLDNPKTRK